MGSNWVAIRHLVAKEGADKRRQALSKPSSHSASAAMVDDRTDLREQPERVRVRVRVRVRL